MKRLITFHFTYFFVKNNGHFTSIIVFSQNIILRSVCRVLDQLMSDEPSKKILRKNWAYEKTGLITKLALKQNLSYNKTCYKKITLCKNWSYKKDFRKIIFFKWTGRELNPRPLPCQGSDLPLIYRPMLRFALPALLIHSILYIKLSP